MAPVPRLGAVAGVDLSADPWWIDHEAFGGCEAMSLSNERWTRIGGVIRRGERLNNIERLGFCQPYHLAVKRKLNAIQTQNAIHAS